MSTPARKPLHTRRITYEGFLREDGLFEMEAELVDTKGEVLHLIERGPVEPGEPVHHMRARVAFDDAMKVVDAEAWMDSSPFPDCAAATAPMRRLVGASIGRGWRKSLDEAMGGVAGCTHLRELLTGLATAAIQTAFGHAEERRRQAGAPLPSPQEPPPYYMGKCKSWDFDGPVMKRVMPAFYRWRPGDGNGD
jgi:hypothetical protein